MKKLLLALTLLASLSSFATEINYTNIVGTFEAKVLTPSPISFGVEAYIVQYDFYEDGTLTYREYHNEDRTIGILGNQETPSCEGTYTIKEGLLKTTTDCSLYTKTYYQEIDLSQTTLEEISKGKSSVVDSTSTLAPGVIMTSEVKKL